MKVEFDDWSACYTGTAFVLEMECAPIVGEEIFIHKSLFPASCFDDEPYIDHPMVEEHDGLIKTTVSIVRHVLTASGHLVQVCIDV